VFGDRRVSWGEFDHRVNRVANALLESGLDNGDRVALLGLNCIETLEIMEWTNERVGKHQKVRRLEFHNDEFTRNPLGKLMKRKLREPYWRGHE